MRNATSLFCRRPAARSCRRSWRRGSRTSSSAPKTLFLTLKTDRTSLITLQSKIPRNVVHAFNCVFITHQCVGIHVLYSNDVFERVIRFCQLDISHVQFSAVRSCTAHRTVLNLAVQTFSVSAPIANMFLHKAYVLCRNSAVYWMNW